MKTKVVGIQGKETKSIDLPIQFDESYRPDLIRRAFRVYSANNRQKYGAYPRAGMRHSAEISRRRREYRGSYGYGISRVQRKVMSRRGRRLFWVGAVVPGTVGGRRAHPPKSSKNWKINLNKKERRKAIRSALAATLSKDIVMQRGHKLNKNYPFVLSDDFEGIKKTKELLEFFQKTGFGDELKRVSSKKVRAGKGKARGRVYKKKKGPLIIVGENCPMIKAAKNIPGVDVADVKHLNMGLLAPGGHAGRLAFFTEKAIKIMKEENLFK
jgi:large subunit ribosomal protein L4e